MTKKLTYLVQLIYDKDYKGYVADVVNLYGCMSQGKTKKEALENAKKAIIAYMEAIEKSTPGKNSEKQIVNIPLTYSSL
ncbi:MAG TPA: type II toxin-antitoxin system HicB family antitoxin [Xanthomonadales bacterium]|nr:type II toxin-antitoxin system HicB family antitoxin [Xanthomonadales bacterium]